MYLKICKDYVEWDNYWCVRKREGVCAHMSVCVCVGVRMRMTNTRGNDLPMIKKSLTPGVRFSLTNILLV